MKIALVYDMIYPFNIGGAELRNYEIAKRLALKHEVHLFGVKMWDGPDVIYRDGIIIHGVCHYSDKYVFSGSRTITESIRFGLKLFVPLYREKFDIIDVSAFAYLHCFTSSLVAKLTRTPIVFTWHQYWGNYWQEYLGGVKGFFGSKIESLVKYLGHNHIAVSQTTKLDLINDGILEKNIYINYCGVDLSLVDKVPVQNIDYDIIFVGRLTHQKNLKLLIEAIKLLRIDQPNILVCLVGDGLEKNRIKELVSQYDLEQNIIFKGLISQRDDLFVEFKKSKIFVLPSLLEGFGIVVVEAEACGLPVIVIENKWNAAQELVDQNINGYICQNKASDLAMKIKEILFNDQLMNSMSKESLLKSQNFDWQRIVDDLEKYYLSILKNGN